MRIGLIGAGEIGRIRAAAVASTAGFELVAVADPAVERARAIHGEAFGDWRAVAEGETLEAVVVSTPPDTHEEIVVAALRAGKHVICEKPLAPDREAARRMVSAARGCGRTLAVGFNQRHFPAVQFVKSFLDEGRLGAVRHVAAYAGHRGLAEFHAAWERDPQSTGGGALMDNGIHLIDLVRYLGGDFDYAEGVRSHAVWGQEAEDNAMALLRAEDGRWASLHASWSEWRGYRQAVEVFCQRGVARVAYGPMYAAVTLVDEPGGRPRTTRRFYPGVAVREKLRGWQSTVVHTFSQELLDLAARLRGEAVASAEGFDGFRAVEIAQAVYSASDERKAIELSDPF